MTDQQTEQRNQFLNFIQRHNRVMTWLSLYLVMIILTSRHIEWLPALIISTNTLLPMLLTWAALEYVLIPRLLHKNRLAYYACSLVLLAFMVIFATQLDVFVYDTYHRLTDAHIDMKIEQELEDKPVYGTVFLHTKYGFLLLSTVAVTTISYLIDERKRQLASFKEEQMQEQLKYLRAQINPHFLFNALNCIYALTMTQDEKAPDSVLKLSEMLRYVIDDCRSDEVLLSKEVKYIQNYIDFQRIRMEHEPNLTFEVQQADPSYKIPPMILQPVIENCFKHSRLVDDPNAWVHITIRQNESGLLFTCDNSKPAVTQFSRQSAITGRQDEERTGIGLMNVQQRLNMLFDGKCSLKVIEDDEHYKTVLHI